MKRSGYKRPLMVMEQFLPQEFIAVCWHVEPNSCYTTLYHDVKRVGGGNGHDGIFNWITSSADENMYYGSPHGSGTHRLPADGYYKTDGPQVVTNDGYYYRDYDLGFEFTSKVNTNTPIYVVTDANNKKHYFFDYKPDGNHS